MKEIPILFSTMMVQANLNDSKTSTRRLKGLEFINEGFPDDWEYLGIDELGHLMKVKNGGTNAIKCPYGRPGDILWVRETWNPWLRGDGTELIEYAADGIRMPIKHVKKYDSFKRRPGIHMNKEYARIWVQVTDVRVERLKDISDTDAIAEGIESYTRIEDIIAYKNYSEFARKDFLNVSKYGFDNGKEIHSAPVASFCTLWIEINGRESWISNPWIWVISYKVLSKTGKPDLNTKGSSLTNKIDM